MKVIKDSIPPKQPDEPLDSFSGTCLACSQKLVSYRNQLVTVPKVFGSLGKAYSSFTSMENTPYIECPKCHVKVYMTLSKKFES